MANAKTEQKYEISEAREFLGDKLELIEDGNGCWLSAKGQKSRVLIRPKYFMPRVPAIRYLCWQAGLTPRPGDFDANSIRTYNKCGNHLCLNPNHYGITEPKPYFPRRGHTKGLSYEEREMVRNDRARGYSFKELSEKYDRAPTTLRQIVLYLGVYERDREIAEWY